MMRHSFAWEKTKRVASTGTELLPITVATLLLYFASTIVNPAMLHTSAGIQTVAMSCNRYLNLEKTCFHTQIQVEPCYENR